MNEWVWSSGHLGWGLFAMLVFTLSWWLLGDALWRVCKVGAVRLAACWVAGWVLGLAMLVIGFG